ncbi:MAG TPA: radical SAM protein [Vicinamibacteria bacterium]|nr:radical SAM protein [Vicinamibacteria bacterium]
MGSTRFRLHAVERRLWRFVRGDDYDRNDGVCRAAPEWLVLCINNFCNLHCKMCDVGLGETGTAFYANLIGDDPRNMSRELLLQVLDQAISFSPPPRVGFAYTEPLLHRGIVDFCREATNRRLYTSITTNGYLLPALAEPLVESGLEHITISVDGPSEVHARVRGSEDSFERLYVGVERLQEARRRRGRKTPRVQFSYTITDENYTDMVRFVRDIAPLTPDSLSFSHLNFVTTEMANTHNTAFRDPELRVARSNLGTMDLHRIDLDALWSELVALQELASRARSWDFTIVPDLSRREDLDVYYREPLRFVGGRRCTDPWRMMLIETDGSVVPAHGRCFHAIMGRLTEEPLDDIWNSSRLANFRKILKEHGGTLPACARCCGVIGKKKTSEENPD